MINSTEISLNQKVPFENTNDYNITKSDWLLFNIDSGENCIKITPDKIQNTPISTLVNSPAQILSYIDYGNESMLNYFDSILYHETDMSNIRRKIIDAVDSKIKITKYNLDLIKEYEITSRDLRFRAKTKNRPKKSSINKKNISQLKDNLVIDVKNQLPVTEEIGVSPGNKNNDQVRKLVEENKNKFSKNRKKNCSVEFHMILNYDGLRSDRMPGEYDSDNSLSSGLSRYLMPGSPIMKNNLNKWVRLIFLLFICV